MTLPQVIAAATQGPAKSIGKPELGSLAVGSPGDASILSLEDGPIAFTDSRGVTEQGDSQLGVAGMVLDGQWWE